MSGPEPSRLRALVNARTWDWLFAMRRGFNVDVQLVDESLQPTLREPGTPSELTDLLRHKPSVLDTPVETAARTGVPQWVVAGDLHCLCFAIDRSRGAGGVLVVARPARLARGGQDRAQSELEVLARWLAAAVEAHLSSPPAGERDAVNRASSLHRMLGSIAIDGTDREMIARFADAMAVWHDLETTGYVEADDGSFAKEVALPGADPARTPARLPAALGEESRPLHAFRAEGVRLGFAPEDVWLVRVPVAGADRSWLLAFSGLVTGDEQIRLHLHVLVLHAWLACAGAASKGRLISAIARQIQRGDPPHAAARQSVDILRRELRAARVWLEVQAPDGAIVLQALSQDSSPSDTPAARVSPPYRRAAADMNVTLVIDLREGCTLTPREHQLVTAALDLLCDWLERAAPRLTAHGERRRLSRAFAELIDRHAAQALQAGSPVSVVVLAPGEIPAPRHIIQQHVVHLRTVLRGTDLVGVVEDREIAVLLQDASFDPARQVAARLARILAAHGEAAPWRIGMAARQPGEAIGGLLDEARRGVEN